MGHSISDTTLRGEILRLADKPGCIVCHAAHEAVDRFFSWYSIEQYHEPSIMQQMQKARGFCPEHTHQFVARSSSHLVSTVYRELLSSAANLVRTAAGEASTPPQLQADLIRPQAICLACTYQEAAVDRVSHRLQMGLADSQVHAVISRPSALCLPHFVHLLPSLDWEMAQLFAHALHSSLMAAWVEYDTNSDPARLVRLLVGANSDEAFLVSPSQSFMTRPSDTYAPDSIQRRDAQGAEERDNVLTKPSSWSPAISHMETLLNAGSCPLCREEETTTTTYLLWLSQELSKRAPTQMIDDIRWLCQSHLWCFLSIGDDKAIRSLLRSLSAYWTNQVQTLISGLEQPPPTSFVMRCRHGMVKARQRTPRVTGWHVFWEGITEGRRSMTQRLAELREPIVRPPLCLACRFQSERADRLAHLLDRALGDAGVIRSYEDASGVCFRHLPLAIRHCTDPSHVRLLLRTQSTRIAVIHWELEEYWQKLNWTHRWEPKGDEQDAWCRAVAQYTGTDVIQDSALHE
jgi:hypothetical protein